MYCEPPIGVKDRAGADQTAPVGQVDHGRQVEPALLGGQVGGVAYEPLPRRGGREVTLEQVGHGCDGRVLPGQAFATAAGDPDDAPLAHDPLDLFTVDRLATSAQLRGDPLGPGFTTHLVDAGIDTSISTVGDARTTHSWSPRSASTRPN